MPLRMTCSCLWLRRHENDGRGPLAFAPGGPLVRIPGPRHACTPVSAPGAIGAFRVHIGRCRPAPRAPERGRPMSTHTPVCALLGIDHPIVSAPMAADPRLPAAVSNAGGLGTLGLWWVDDAGALVRDTAALTDRPFGGNFALTSDQHRRVDQALAAGLRIVSFIFGDPASYVDSVHDAGGLVMHTVGSAEEARRAVACGADIVVAQGWEAGGHVWSGVATLPLVPAVVDAVAPLPVIAAGGIGDARGVAAVLALGAQAAWLGTRFLLSEEMPIHEDYRRRLLAAAETDPQWYANLYEVGWPDSSHRALRNSTSRAWEAAGRPLPGQRPGEGDVIAHFSSGEDIVR